jgi:hypothetical protein
VITLDRIKIMVKGVEIATPSITTAHLGANPKKGGNPPRDRNRREIGVNLFIFKIVCLRWKTLNLSKKPIRVNEIAM